MTLASLKEIRDFDAKERMHRLYASLESALKWHQPRDYSAFVAQKLALAFEKPELLARYRPHHALHSVEANCAFSNQRFCDGVKNEHLDHVMNLYHEHQDPMHSGLLNDEKLDHFFLVMHREQMEVQYAASRNEMARYQALFLADEPIPKLANTMQRERGISVGSWIATCYFAVTAADQSPEKVFHKSVFSASPQYGVSENEVEQFLSQSSVSPREIRDRFVGLREKTKPQFHSQIRSVFLEYPLIRLEDDFYVSPHPPLLLRHSGQGLYKTLKGFPYFGNEFGETVCRFICKLLASLEEYEHLLTSSDLERYSPGKSCDFLVEFEDVILLVESKATSFVAERLVDSAILNDGSTTKIAKGIEQLHTTAYDVRSETFAKLGIDAKKEVIGVVATFGEIPFANSDWYRKSFIEKRAESRLAEPIFPSENMTQWPIVMSLESVEHLVATLNSFDSGLNDLVKEKDAKPYIQVGDWDRFLVSKMSEDPTRVQSIPFLLEYERAFLERFRD